MATQITQIDLPDQHRTVLRIEGDMQLDDALVVEKIATCINEENGNRVAIDLADLDFLDSNAASVLRRMDKLEKFEIEGTEIFLQSAVDLAERS
jgi:anti-anti-sigma regulatory factor